MNLLKSTVHPKTQSGRKSGVGALLMTALFIIGLTSSVNAHDADHKKVITKWNSEGQISQLNGQEDIYQGVMKGTFIVKDNRGVSHYMHSAQMSCPFWVRINSNGQDQLQGACHLVNEKGDTAQADIFCTGNKENCTGIWSFTSGSGNLAGIRGGGPLKIRVDLLKKEKAGEPTDFVTQNMKASGYLYINELQDNVVNRDRFPIVQ